MRNAKGAGNLYGTQDMTLPEFIDFVREQRGEFPSGDTGRKVDIVAHSQGGLVTLAALRNPSTNLPDGTSKVRKVITLGTPVLGSPKALALLQYQAGCFPDVFPYNGECITNPATLQATITNFPGLYQLLDRGDQPGPRRQREQGPQCCADGRRRRLSPRGGRLGSRPVGRSLDRNPGQLRQGGGRQPVYPRLYEEVRGQRPDCLTDINVVCGPGENVEYEFKMTRNDRVEGGDGTVPIHSADLYNPGKGVDLRGGVPNFYAHGTEHQGLANDDAVLGYVLSFLGSAEAGSQPAQQASTPLGGFASLRTAQAEPLDELTKLAQENGLDTTPESFSGVELVTEGPVSGFVEDAKGRILGKASDAPSDRISEDIPGSDYNSVSDSRSFFFNEEGAYTAKLRALEGEENVKLKVRTYADGQLTGQAFFRIDPAAGDALVLPLAPGRALGELELSVDGAGDGTVERRTDPTSVATGSAASDTLAPETRAVVEVVAPQTPRGSAGPQEAGGRGRPRPTEAVVALTAEDEGSAVSETYYALPGDDRPRRYAEPFTVPLGTVVRFASLDKAGNSEAPKEVLVDDAPSTREAAEPIFPGDDLTRYVDPEGDADWYRFDVTGGSGYRVQLHGLPADYDLTVYDEEGREVAAPAERGKRSESVGLSPGSGTYFLKVAGFGKEWSAERPYKLKLEGP